MKFLVLISALFLFQFAEAYSEVFWADTVLGVSSSSSGKVRGGKAFSAEQALGKPSVMPDFGESPAAWMPDMRRSSIEWIKIGFRTAHLVRQISVAEIYPGAISKIYLNDESGNEFLVFNNVIPSQLTGRGRMFNVILDKEYNNINAVKIELSLKEYIDNYQIDAIGLSSSTDSIRHYINLPQSIEDVFHKENLGKNVNSPYSELGPVITGDGSKLFFTRDAHPQNIGANLNQDVWVSYKNPDGSFSEAMNIGSPINNEKNNFVIGASQDGSTIYVGNVYNPDGTLSKGMSKSRKTADSWGFPEKIEIEDAYNLSRHASYSFAANGKAIIMSVEREDSFGQSDLYVSFLKQDGSWQAPINLGATINTAANEESPFLASDGVSLYYSTSGLPGYGSNDMFVSRRLDDTWQNWSEPVNLGPQINTKGWDGYYTITASGKWAYFVSNENSIGQEDIFRIRLPKELKPRDVVLIKGRVLNSKGRKPLSATIIYENLADGENAGIAYSNPENGEYTISLPGGKKYAFLAQAKGFASVNQSIDLTELNEFKEINQDLFLVPLESGQAVRLNNIFFEFGKHELLPESFIELKRIVELLNSNKEIKISIEGHTDNIGTMSANLELSTNRAKAVYNYLISLGIDAKRLKYKGFGAMFPIAPNDSDENRQRNRRVQFKID